MNSQVQLISRVILGGYTQISCSVICNLSCFTSFCCRIHSIFSSRLLCLIFEKKKLSANRYAFVQFPYKYLHTQIHSTTEHGRENSLKKKLGPYRLVGIFYANRYWKFHLIGLSINRDFNRSEWPHSIFFFEIIFNFTVVYSPAPPSFSFPSFILIKAKNCSESPIIISLGIIASAKSVWKKRRERKN